MLGHDCAQLELELETPAIHKVINENCNQIHTIPHAHPRKFESKIYFVDSVLVHLIEEVQVHH